MVQQQTQFECIISDADTFLLRAAKAVEEDYIMATNKHNGESREFKNKTVFYGHWAKKDKGELRDWSSFLGCDHLTADDFEIEECVRLIDDIDDHLKEAEKQFDMAVGRLKRTGYADDYKLLLGGEGNFRYECAKRLPYKGERKDKPLIFQELKELIFEKYKHKVVISNGIESDDTAAIYGWENFLHYNKTGVWKYILAYIDKDLDQIVSPSFNPDKPDKGIQYQTPVGAARCLAIQMLMGDLGTDNIAGVPNLTEEIQEKHSLGKTRGVGKATAEKLLAESETPKEFFQVVVDCYKSYYGDEPKPFVTHTGEEVTWTWLDYLQDSAKLLYLQRSEGEDYSVTTTLDKLGVDYK